MDLGLTGARVLVGGASRGIGFATASAFLEEGANVALIARGAEGLERARADLAAAFPAATVVAAAGDLSDAAAAAAVVSEAVAGLGGLDVAVANVGGGSGPAEASVDSGVWSDLIGQNLISAVHVCQEAAAVMPAGGSIVLIGSIAGLADVGAPLPYQAAKAALTRYGHDLARRVAGRGIRVNLVAPGNVLFPGGSWERHLTADRARVEGYIGAEVPLARFGTPEEIASAVVFLCSARSSFTTGACLVVDGGQLRA